VQWRGNAVVGEEEEECFAVMAEIGRVVASAKDHFQSQSIVAVSTLRR
jgi:hypothetical protein